MMMNNMSQGLGSFNNMMPQNNMMQQNPYGQQMNPQMMGQQMQSPEMFSEQLMNPMMSQIQDPMQGLQPMAEPEGFGVYGQSLEGYAEGGEAVPRETEIMGQPHMLAYINPEEEMMLRQMGGSGMAGPGGVPSYPPSTQSGPGANVGPSSDRGTRGSANNDRDERIRAASNLAKLQAQAAAAEKMMADQAAQQLAADQAAQQLAADQAAQQLAAETLAAQQAVDLEGYGSDLPANNVTAGLGPVTPEDLDAVTAGNTATTSTAADTALKTSLVPKSRIADLTDNSKTSGIMSVFNDVKTGLKDFISDVGMTYAGGLGSFSDLSDQAKYDEQYAKLVDLDYDPAEVTRYLDLTRATQKTIRDDTLEIGKTISKEDRALMRDERLADEARLASLAVGTGIDTIPIPVDPVPLPITGAGTVGSNYNVMPESQYDYGYDSTLYKGGASGPVEQQIVEQTMPEVGSPNAVVPTQVPAATVDPMTPVGGNFLLPGQQNYGPTPAAALNFNPNTYMQTPQNANVALSAMFQGSNPYTFEELLSQYKPAYSSFG